MSSPEALEFSKQGWRAESSPVAYGKPALEKSVNVTVQAAGWTTQNPVLAACVVVGASGAVVFAAPSLATAPVLSSMGFTTGEFTQACAKSQELTY
ncbi:hypothetical protein N7508_011087 [Penicillium antarcticum]|uniref:uncharacterized protein n=1 Tax=Penicillium antarcticum TaxID=416450 RepID=UPI002387FAE2|nr:uncharacterized protein N7508_011087 [Penicillium antarcticum]KAJ5288312.1 hypothetical protein N7508_011087 [Penicillium antarcticum]